MKQTKTIVSIFTTLLILTGCTTQTKKTNFLINPDKSEKNTSWTRVAPIIPTFNVQDHSDGCSGGMSKIYSKLNLLHKEHGNKLAWRHCCEVHDKAYYYGGSKDEKKEADELLEQCVTKEIGNSFLGKVMKAAVWKGGAPYLPTSYRWGYGEDFRNIGKAIDSQTAGQYAIYAMMSANAYHNDKNSRFLLHLDGWELIDLDDKPTNMPAFDDQKTGLAFDIWKQKSNNQVVFSFRGTDSPLDFPLINFKFTSPPRAFEQAQEKLLAYQEKHPSTKLIATGHSLGGGLSLGLSTRNESIDAITFDTSPNDHDPHSRNNNDAKRVLIYQKGEVLAKIRKHVEFLGKPSTIPAENIFYTDFDFGKGPISRHDSYPLALGLLKLGADSNPRLKIIYKTVKPDPEITEKAAEINWMDQTALAALFATHKKEMGSTKITENFSDALCVKGNDPSIPPVNWNDVVKRIEQEAIGGTSGLNEEQRKEAWQLLVSGRAIDDIRGSVESTLLNMTNINPKLLRKTVTNAMDPYHTISLFGSLKKDLKISEQSGNPIILNNTLNAIKNEPLGVVVSDSVKIFINRENRTMRLAIIAYARMNGINITEDNLDDLYDLFGDNPDLYPLLVGAVNTMKEEYGVNEMADGMKQAKKKIEEIKQNENNCS